MSSTRLTPDASGHWLRLFLPFAVGYYLSYLLRNANAVIAPVLTSELNLSAADLGLLTSAYFVAFGAFQIPLGILLDRYGARRVEATLMLFAAAGTLVFAFGQNIAELALGRALIGLGVSACLMAGLKNFSLWYPPERQSSLTGAIMASGGLGAISASVPLEVMLPVFGWRGIFLALTTVIVAAAAYLYFAVPDRRDAVAPTSLREQWQGVVHVFGSRDFWRYAPFMMLFPGGFMAVTGLWVVPWLINVDGLSRDTAAQYLFAIGVTQLASFFAIAAFATRLIRRGVKPVGLVSSTHAVGWLCLLLILADAGPALLWWTVYSFCSATSTLLYAALGTHFPTHLFGRVSTALNLMAFVGAFSLQWGIGVVVDLFVAVDWSAANAYRAGFAIMALLQLLAWIWFALESRRQAERHRALARPVPPAP